MPTFDPYLRRMVNGPEAGQNTEVDGFTVGFLGSTDGTVYNAGSGLTLSGNVFAADLAAAGYRLALNGGTVSVARYMPVETVSGSSVTMLAGHAYKVYATSSAITLNAETVPENQFGLEGHLELFVAGTGYVVTGTNVVLANALEPDAVNNCTVRFHDGVAIISVEDHIAGYIVVSATGTTAGTLPYGLSTASQEYIAVDASLNGSTLDLAGAVAEGEKHIVGNGYNETTLTGAVNCGTSKFTVANLALSDVQVTGGTMTLGDVYIPSGSTVAVSGGGLAVEKVTGAGSDSVIDLGGTKINAAAPIVMSGALITNGHAFGSTNIEKNGGALLVNGTSALIQDCVFSGNHADRNGGAIATNGITALNLSNCVFENNVADYGTNSTIHIIGGTATMTDCTLKSQRIFTIATPFLFRGSNTLTGNASCYSDDTHTVTLTPGAILDLTGNTNETPINPGGGVIVDGGCQVITSAGSSVSISGGTYTKINNDGTTE